MPRVAPVSERAVAEWAMSYSSRCTWALSAGLPVFPPSVPLAFVVGGNRVDQVGWLVESFLILRHFVATLIQPKHALCRD